MANPIVVRFVRERESKNAVRFEEVTKEGEPPKVRTLYVQKWVIGGAQQLEVTINIVPPDE